MARKLITLKAAVRKASGTCRARALRRGGRMPAVMYGGGPTTMLELSRGEFEEAISRGERLVALRIEGASPAERQAVIREVQYEPVSHRPIHVDFVEIRADQKITVKVPLVAKGTAAGAVSGGVLNMVLREVAVECLPADVPSDLRVDVAALNIGDVIRAGQLKLPEGVSLTVGADVVVVALEAPRTEKDLEAAVATEGTAGPEVLTAKKEEAEAAAPAAEGAAAAAPAAEAAKAEAKKPEAKEEKK
jgi:large subunit ribosomal protein L25